MRLGDYQKLVNDESRYPDKGNNLILIALGLAEEAGEAAGVVKKCYRDSGGDILADDYRERLRKELGDTLWYVAVAAWEADLNLEDIAHANLAKLRDRRARGVEAGFGDDR